MLQPIECTDIPLLKKKQSFQQHSFLISWLCRVWEEREQELLLQVSAFLLEAQHQTWGQWEKDGWTTWIEACPLWPEEELRSTWVEKEFQDQQASVAFHPCIP